MFWRNVNQLFAYAEQHHIDAVPVQLFGEGEVTTIHDLYLSLMMVSTLTSGNLATRQIRFAYQLSLLTSNTMALGQDYQGDASFMINLSVGLPPGRVRDAMPKGNIRVWSTAELVDQLTNWVSVFESGAVPSELKAIMTAGWMQACCAIYAVNGRSDPICMSARSVFGLIASRSRWRSVLHSCTSWCASRKKRLVKIRAVPVAMTIISIPLTKYVSTGFVTSRRRERQVLPLQQQQAEQFPFWDVDNRSETGLGLSLPALGNEWVALGTLLGFRSVVIMTGRSGW